MSLHQSLLVLITFNSRLILATPNYNGICQIPLCCYYTFISDQIIYSSCSLLVFVTLSQNLTKRTSSFLPQEANRCFIFDLSTNNRYLLREIVIPIHVLYLHIKDRRGAWGIRTPNSTVIKRSMG